MPLPPLKNVKEKLHIPQIPLKPLKRNIRGLVISYILFHFPKPVLNPPKNSEN